MTRWLRMMLACVGACAIGGVARGQAQAPPERFDGHRVVRVHPRSIREMRAALALTDDVWTCAFSGSAGDAVMTPAPIDIRVTPEQLAGLAAAGVPHEVLIQNVQALIDAERVGVAGDGIGVRGPGAFFTAFQDYAAVNAYVGTLAALRPDLASRVSLGQSIQQREIFGLRLTSPGAAPGTRPAVVVYACQHAREWITVMSAMYLADQLVREYDTNPTVHRLLDSYEFHIVPIVNPDGYAYTWTTNRLWRKNRRMNVDASFGVDLNRNWGHQWGLAGSSGSTTSDTYRGTAAFSEPCTTALRDFIAARPNVALTFDLHSYSQVLLEPWAWTFDLPPDARTYTQISAAMQGAMHAVAGEYFVGGESYRALYPISGGSHDWCLGVRGAVAYGVELRDRGSYGFVPPPSEIVPGAREAQAGVHAAALWLLDHSLAATFADGEPRWVRAGVPATVRVQLSRGLRPLGDPAAGAPVLHARLGRLAPYVATPLTSVGTDEGGRVFEHALPAAPCSGVVQWYYTLTLPDGSVASAPAGGPEAPYQASARTTTLVRTDDFEGADGWSVGDTTPGSADTATVGLWSRADPNGTTAQPENDHTGLAGTACYITGQNARGDADFGRVGVGKTTLTSPVFDGLGPSGASGSRLDAAMWLWSMTSRTETFTVDVTTNPGAALPTWVRALTIDASSAISVTTPRWNRHVLRLSDVVTPSATMRLRFVARATGPNDVVEIALDDLAIERVACERPSCPGDYNLDGMVSVSDLMDYVNDWLNSAFRAGAGGAARPGIDDLYRFLAAWFGAC